MSLLAILICIAVQKFIGFGTSWHQLRICHHYFSWMRDKLVKPGVMPSYVAIAALIVPTLVVTALISCFLYSFLFGIFGLLFSLAVLFYTLGDGNLEQQLTEYYAASERGDFKAANEYAKDFIGDVEVTDFPSLSRAVTCALLRKSLTKYFAILFWFVMLGPLGAVLYYGITIINQMSQDKDGRFEELGVAIAQIQGVLDWVPVRLLGLSYALVGHFGAGFTHGWKNILSGIDRCQEFIVNIGFASLEIDPEDNSKSSIKENRSTLAMMHRALVVWVVAIALLMI